MWKSGNAEGIFKESLELTSEDVYTPWKWGHFFRHRSGREAFLKAIDFFSVPLPMLIHRENFKS